MLGFMAIVIPQGYAKILHSLTLAGDAERMAVTYGVSVDPGVTVADVGDLAAECAQAFIDNALDLISNQYSVTETVATVQLGVVGVDDPVIGTSAASGTGAQVGDPVPQNTAFLVHKRTATGGRGGRGRMYLPGVPEAQVNHVGALTGAAVTAGNLNLEQFRLDVNFAPTVTSMVLLHNSPGAYAAALPHPITALTLDTIVSTQRRRLRK